MAVVLKEFPCSFDGIHSEILKVGDVREFGTMTDGLVAGGLISVDAPKADSNVTASIVADPVSSETLTMQSPPVKTFKHKKR